MNTITTERRTCSSFQGRYCLLTSKCPEEWNCCLCQAVDRWTELGFRRVFVRESLKGKSLVYVFPSNLPNEAHDDCILTLGVTHDSRDDLRTTLNTLLDIADEVWIWDSCEAEYSRRLKP